MFTVKTAWFLVHRIRFAMNDEIESAEKLNGIVEADETYVGGKGKGKWSWSCKENSGIFTDRKRWSCSVYCYEESYRKKPEIYYP